MSNKVRWGVLGTAGIAVRKVIPAMQRSRWGRVQAIASREPSKARRAAERLGIPRAYGSYEALLEDPDIEAIYVPLPNLLHAPWSIRAARAGKHVLCEKPLGLTATEVRSLIEAQAQTGVMIQEALMVVGHPQWRGALDIVASGRLGRVRAVLGHFSYHNADPADIRNVASLGGGALLDVGCYLVFAARRFFGSMPRRVLGSCQTAPGLDTDVLTSVVMEFAAGHCIFTCDMQSAHSQGLQVLGDRARMEIEYPFTPPGDRRCRIFVNGGLDPGRNGDETIEYESCDQYLLQADAFSEALRRNSAQPLPLSDSLENAAVIQAITRSMRTQGWEIPVID